MRKLRLLLACCIAAGMAVPLASPAAAQEPDCSGAWIGDYIFSVFPPTYPVVDGLVALGEGTVTIRGGEAIEYLASLPEHYTSSAETFLACLQQEYVDGIVDSVTPVAECLQEALESLLASPDLASRYIQVGPDLEVTIDYGQALDDVTAITNCNGIITSG